MMTNRTANSVGSIACLSEDTVERWPRAIAWLAVIAHVCVALVIWDTPHRRDIILSGAVGFSQVNLVVVWLVLSSTHPIRRVPWALCALSGLALAFHSGKPFGVEHLGVAYILAQVITAAIIALPLRLLGYRLMQPHAAILHGDQRRSSQFSILELFVAAFAIALASAMLVRIRPPSWLFGDYGVMTALLGNAIGKTWPFSLVTVIAVSGLRPPGWLFLQVVASASIAILLLAFVSNVRSHAPLLIFSSHWFVVASTLWIFQMCGYRLARFKEIETADGNHARYVTDSTSLSAMEQNEDRESGSRGDKETRVEAGI